MFLVSPDQHDVVTGPLVGIIALVVLILLCRWVFSTKDRDERAARRAADALAAAQAQGDFGLLVSIATVRTHDDAELLRSVLADGGIRATVSPGEQPGERVVLVFRHDETTARALVSR